MQHPRLVISRNAGAGLGPFRSASRRAGTGGNLLRPHGNRLRLCVLLAAALCAARFFSWLASPTATRDWAGNNVQKPPVTASQLNNEQPQVARKEATVWPSPPPVRAPQAVQSPPPSPPLSPPPVPPPAPTAVTQPPGCRTCAVASHLVFNSHAVKLFTTIDARPKRGLFVRPEHASVCGFCAALRTADAAAPLHAHSR